MTTQLQAILRLWIGRLLMFLLAALIVVALAFLPTGIIRFEGPPQPEGYPGAIRTEPMMRFKVEPIKDPEANWRAVWSFRQYAQALGEYGKALRDGSLTVRNWYGVYPPPTTPEPLLPILKSISLNSFSLFAQALGVGLLLGMLTGALILGRGGAKAFSVGVSVTGMALPDFLLVILCQLITIWTYRQFDLRLWSVLGPQGGERGWLLPLVALSVVPMAYTARLVATALDEVMRQEFIRTARAKGVPEWLVVLKHGMRNVLPRVLNGVPSMMNTTLSSLLVVEVLANVNGLGSGLMRGLTHFDPQAIATTGLIFCIWFTLMDGLTNTLRAMANPQLREVSQ